MKVLIMFRRLSQWGIPRSLTFGFLVLVLAFSLRGQSNLAFGDRYAVIVGGIGGLEEYSDRYFSQTSRMYDLLTNRLGYDRDKVVYLFESTDYDSANIAYESTAENVRQVFQELSQRMGKNDQLLVFLVGHGTFDGTWSKFNLVGPDLRDIDFVELFAALPSRRIVLVNTASASGPFVERLSGEERVIVTATKSGYQHFETNFADFFLDALATDESDFNKDGRISMFEAFEFAKTSQDRWFEEQRRIRAEHPLLDDNGDGKGSQELEASDDGLWASRVYIDPLPEELKTSLESFKGGAQTKADSLNLQKLALEQQIEDLKAKKPQMAPAEYSKQLETLLIRLAKVSRDLREIR